MSANDELEEARTGEVALRLTNTREIKSGECHNLLI